MQVKHESPNFGRLQTYFWAAILLATSPVWPASAQSAGGAGEPVTAKIALGPREGAAHPTGCGRTATGGGNIYVAQPAPDTVVIRMAGNVAACGNLLVSANASIDFRQDLQFSVEFSHPGHTGQLIMESKIIGVLSCKGTHAAVGLTGATASITCGPNAITTLPMPPRTVGSGESFALNSSQGPICAPIYGGCYQLHQVFGVFANQQGGGVCGKAVAEFSPTPLSPTWTGPSYPFQQVDKTDFGYEVTLRVVPDPQPTPGPGSNDAVSLFPAPTGSWNNQR
jgi:hypothetical protein